MAVLLSERNLRSLFLIFERLYVSGFCCMGESVNHKTETDSSWFKSMIDC